LHIGVVGLRGIGFEINKCLVLQGINTLNLTDDTICEIQDLGANPYLKVEHVGKVSRAEACATTL